MKVVKIFGVEVNHGYCSNGNCCFISLTPTKECAFKLKRHRLWWRDLSQGRYVLYAHREDYDWISVLKDEEFDFEMFSKSISLNAITNAPVKKEEESYYISQSKNNSTSLQLSVSKKTVSSKWTFAIVNIEFREPLAQTYTINLEALSQKWKYYVINNKNSKAYKIEGHSQELKFTGISIDNKKDSIYQLISERFPHSDITLFESGKAIAYNDSGVKNIRLINVDNNSIVINHLPNPELDSNGVRVINLLR